jgi:HD superfamily phosphohydrolase
MRRHEQWTAAIIRNEAGEIRPLLEAHREGFAEEVAALLEKEDPETIYHAVVSSSFDADRLDYLRRDRQMTGTAAGAIDFDWLIDNLRVAEIGIDTPDGPEASARKVPTFCLTAKALPAAEQFLLARYTLHQQVYFHKTTRCVEHMIGRLMRRLAELVQTKKGITQTGLTPAHPLIRFLGKVGESVENYLALDDQCVLGALGSMRGATDDILRDMADRLLSRRLYKTLDLAEIGADLGGQLAHLRTIRQHYAQKIEAETVMVDDKAVVGIYATIGGDGERMHKRLHVLDGDRPKEISELSELIRALETRKLEFTRVFFAEVADRDRARALRR